MLDVLHRDWCRDAEMTAYLDAAAGVGGLTAAAPAVVEEEPPLRADAALVQQAVWW